MLDAVVAYLPSPLDVPPVIGEHPTTHAEVLRTVDDGEPFSALAFKIAADPYVGQAGLLPGLLRDAQGRVLHPQLVEGPQGADRAHPPDARQPPRGDRRGPRRRHRGRGRPQGDLHRRHPRRSRPPGDPRVDDLPRAGHRGEDRAQDEGRPGQDGPRARPPGRGGPDLPGQDRRGERRDAHRRHGRAPPRRPRGPDDPRVQGGRQHRQAAGLLPRDDPARLPRATAASSARPAARASTGT